MYPEIMVGLFVIKSQTCLEIELLSSVLDRHRPWVGFDSSIGLAWWRSWRLRVWNFTNAPFYLNFVVRTRIIFARTRRLSCGHLYERFLWHHDGSRCFKLWAGHCVVLTVEFSKHARYKRQRIGEVRRLVLLCT